VESSWVHSARRPLIGILYLSGWLWWWIICGMKIGRGNRSIRRKPAPPPLCPPQIPLDQTRAGTRAAAVGSQRLTAWAMPWPCTDSRPFKRTHFQLGKWFCFSLYILEEARGIHFGRIHYSDLNLHWSYSTEKYNWDISFTFSRSTGLSWHSEFS
jgi:hypothetical protein